MTEKIVDWDIKPQHKQTNHQKLDIKQKIFYQHARNVNYKATVGNFANTVWVTKSGSVLPLYKISVLLKTGGAGVFIIAYNIN